MKRRLFIVASMFSVLLLAVTVLVLVASYMTWSPVPRVIGTDFFHFYRGEASFGTRTSVMFQGRLVYHYEPSIRLDLWHVAYAAAVLPFVGVARLFGRRLGHFWRRQRGSGGLCSRCAYNLTGNTSGVCPECGSAVVGKVGT
jgi:hypothetical protein